jgi:hypothetical protein
MAGNHFKQQTADQTPPSAGQWSWDAAETIIPAARRLPSAPFLFSPPIPFFVTLFFTLPTAFFLLFLPIPFPAAASGGGANVYNR